MGGSFLDRLRSGGYLNVDAPDIGELTSSVHRIAMAYCTSPICAKSKAKVRKRVLREKVECPDCGYALMWKVETIVE